MKANKCRQTAVLIFISVSSFLIGRQLTFSSQNSSQLTQPPQDRLRPAKSTNLEEEEAEIEKKFEDKFQFDHVEKDKKLAEKLQFDPVDIDKQFEEKLQFDHVDIDKQFEEKLLFDHRAEAEKPSFSLNEKNVTIAQQQYSKETDEDPPKESAEEGKDVAVQPNVVKVADEIFKETQENVEKPINNVVDANPELAVDNNNNGNLRANVFKPQVVTNSRCPKKFGKVGIFVVYTNSSQYTHAMNVLWCYALSRGYELFLVQPFEDALSVEKCGTYNEVMFRKFCVAAEYLSKVDWLVVTDADTTVVNADRCFEDYFDSKAEIMLYERFFSAEIMSGNILARNTPGAKEFLRGIAKIEPEAPPMPYFFSYDNGAIHLLTVRILHPLKKREHKRCFELVKTSQWPDWEPGYGAYARCTKRMMLDYSLRRNGPARIRIKMFPRAQGWARDIYDTWFNRWPGDFMAHSIKTEEPFDLNMLDRLKLLWKNMIPNECLDPNWSPKMVTGKLVDEAEMRNQLRYVATEFEKAKLKPLFANMHFEKCWPNCSLVIKSYN